jgi:hypothetical protein
LVFILPLPSDIELLSFLLCFIARLSPVLVPSGAPVVKTSPDDTAPLGLLGAGAVPLGTVLGLAVLGVRGSVWAGVVWVGVVWARAALVLHRAAATRKCVSFIGRVER